MSFWTFFLYLIGGLILIRVIYIVIIVLLVSVAKSNRRADYNRTPTYASSKTEPKLFSDHESGELAKKLGDLS